MNTRTNIRLTLWPAAVITLALTALAPLHADPLTISTPLDSRPATSQESNFGDLLADSILSVAPTADFALAPAGELRPVVIDAGKSSTDSLTDALRSGNEPADTIVVLRLTGAQVRAALAHGASRAPGPYDGFLQVAGLSVRYDMSKHGEERMKSATLTRSGVTLDPHATYSVAMTRYLADGALGYFDIWSGSGSQTDTHVSLADALARYAEAHQPLAYQTDDRIGKA